MGIWSVPGNISFSTYQEKSQSQKICAQLLMPHTCVSNLRGGRSRRSGSIEIPNSKGTADKKNTQYCYCWMNHWKWATLLGKLVSVGSVFSNAFIVYTNFYSLGDWQKKKVKTWSKDPTTGGKT
jgi:hypothetical protein